MSTAPSSSTIPGGPARQYHLKAYSATDLFDRVDVWRLRGYRVAKLWYEKESWWRTAYHANVAQDSTTQKAVDDLTDKIKYSNDQIAAVVDANKS